MKINFSEQLTKALKLVVVPLITTLIMRETVCARTTHTHTHTCAGDRVSTPNTILLLLSVNIILTEMINRGNSEVLLTTIYSDFVKNLM